MVAEEPGAAPAGHERRRRRAHRQGHQPRRAAVPHELLRERRRLGRQPRGVVHAQVPPRARPRPHRRGRPRPGSPAGRPDGARGGGEPAMSLLDKKTAIDLTKLLIFIVVTTLATGVLVVTIGNVSFAGSKEYKAEFVDATGVVKGDDIRVAGVKVGVVKDVEIVDRTRALVTFSVADDTSDHRRHERRDPLPQPRGPALHHAHPGDRRLRAARRGRDHPGLADLARPSTSPSSSTASSRCSRRCRRPTSTSCPTRSSRSSRARAARSRACSRTRRRSPRPSPRATRSSAT